MKFPRATSLRAVPFFLILACASQPPIAESAPPQLPAETPSQAGAASALKRVEASYTKAGTLQAKFKQTVLSALTKTEKISEGVIKLSYPGRVRWEVTQPEPELVVSDGVTLWHYTPPFDPEDSTDKGQAIKRDAKKLGSQWLETILAGRFSKLKGLDVKSIKPREFHLVPAKNSKEELIQAEIRLHPTQDVIENVVIKFKSGNRTEVALSEVTLALKIPPAQFEFKPPPGTDIVSGK